MSDERRGTCRTCAVVALALVVAAVLVVAANRRTLRSRLNATLLAYDATFDRASVDVLLDGDQAAIDALARRLVTIPDERWEGFVGGVEAVGARARVGLVRVLAAVEDDRTRGRLVERLADALAGGDDDEVVVHYRGSVHFHRRRAGELASRTFSREPPREAALAWAQWLAARDRVPRDLPGELASRMDHLSRVGPGLGVHLETRVAAVTSHGAAAIAGVRPGQLVTLDAGGTLVAHVGESRVALGARGGPGSETSLRVADGVRLELVVDRVYRGLAADRAGLRGGDAIVAIDGAKVLSRDGLTRSLLGKERVLVSVARPTGERLTIPVTLD